MPLEVTIFLRCEIGLVCRSIGDLFIHTFYGVVRRPGLGQCIKGHGARSMLNYGLCYLVGKFFQGLVLIRRAPGTIYLIFFDGYIGCRYFKAVVRRFSLCFVCNLGFETWNFGMVLFASFSVYRGGGFVAGEGFLYAS